MKHLMQVLKANSEDPTVISLAIDVVAVAGDDHLASQLIEFLLGEMDGIPKVSIVRAAFASLTDHRLSLKLVPTFADRGCHVVSVTSLRP
jgi:hypothetical protein